MRRSMKAFFCGAPNILKAITNSPKGEIVDVEVELVYDQTTLGNGNDYLEVIFRHPTEKWSFQARIRKEHAPELLENATWLASQKRE